jgi:predicted ABC-type transport system involved in lysophospholipase L1 biosynthesis ATPase subunit
MNDAERARVRNRQVGFVFQFYHLLPELNALENVMLPMMVMAGRTENMNNIRSRAKVALEAAGMGSRLDHKPSQLSGGEQQRVAIARALINEPRVLLCDEPTGNLDSVTGAGIIDMLMTFAKGASRTLVMVTHDHEVAARCGRVIAMKDGLLAAA